MVQQFPREPRSGVRIREQGDGHASLRKDPEYSGDPSLAAAVLGHAGARQVPAQSLVHGRRWRRALQQLRSQHQCV
jgi:hypothetical protein